ncbi:MAG: PD-(D/E)XK nuclease family protein [Elusimicrobia bacterium]|nr:PD-(D/E)XK nuclease family protein [Elusimicrobiota bacterium]
MTELFIEPEVLQPADRSTLENAAECPRQARFIELGAVLNTSFAMASGQGCHDAFSAAISDYVDSRGQASFDDTKQLLLQELAKARPDVQPDVIKGAERSAYAFARYLHDLHWENIRCWDGGRGEHSSQFAVDMEEFGLRVTSELDMLHDSESPEVLTEVDFKSGFALWRHGDVRSSFQFQLHALLVAEKFHTIKALEVRVWNTRLNSLTYPVLFKLDSESLYSIKYRVRNAAKAYFDTRGKEPNDCEPWPLVEKCAACPAAHLCDAARAPEGAPEQWVDKIVMLEAQASALSKLAAKRVKETGRDIVTERGNHFGTDRPKRKSSPKFEAYQLKTKSEEAAEID